MNFFLKHSVDVLNLKLVNYGMSYLLMLEIYSLLNVSNLNFESIFLACVDLIGLLELCVTLYFNAVFSFNILLTRF